MKNNEKIRKIKKIKSKTKKEKLLKQYANRDDNVALFCADLSVDFPRIFLCFFGLKSPRPLQIKFSNWQRPFLMSQSALPWLASSHRRIRPTATADIFNFLILCNITVKPHTQHRDSERERGGRARRRETHTNKQVKSRLDRSLHSLPVEFSVFKILFTNQFPLSQKFSQTRQSCSFHNYLCICVAIKVKVCCTISTLLAHRTLIHYFSYLCATWWQSYNATRLQSQQQEQQKIAK